MTVGEYMTSWLEDSAKGDLGPRTYHNYKLQIRLYISPAFGPLKLSTLTSGHVQSLYASKPRGAKPLKPSSVQYIHAVLHRALEQAVRFHMIPFDPAARVDPPKVRQDEITPLNTEQSRTLLAAAEDSGAAKLSGRLKWSDVDLVKGTFGWPGSYRGCATVTDLCSQSRRMPAGAP